MPKADPSLGDYLKLLREAAGLTLRQVEEKTDRAVKNSYLSQIENGDIQTPSPHILYGLAGVYGVPYADLMARAGYHVTEERVPMKQRELKGIPLRALADLDDRDREELVEFIAYLRSRKRKKP